ncbi:MAG: carboxylesterase/lipase family protein [Luteimonas sp.]
MKTTKSVMSLNGLTACVAAIVASLGIAGCDLNLSSVALELDSQARHPGPAAVVTSRDATHALVRRTSAGRLRGVDDSAHSGTYWWKGVRFAQAPAGALRWRAPAQPASWSGIRRADRFGQACLQIGRLYGPGANNAYDATIGTTLGTAVGNEDCLSLNIWRPATSERELPVMLFLHGGSGVSGYTADPLYDGAALARTANAIVVTANYRLGLLGALNLPQLHTGSGNGEDSGNFALLDHVATLRYLQQNIAAFGGDPDNITLTGHSAGAVNLLALLASPMTQGLFHKAMPLSGGISLASNLPPGAQPTLRSAADALGRAQNFLQAVVIADGKASDAAEARAYIDSQTPAQIADYLRSHDPSELLVLAAQKSLNFGGPIPDGSVVPVDPIATFAAGQYPRMPVLAGNTREEGKLFSNLLTELGGKPGYKIDDATHFAMLYGFNPDQPTALTVADIIDPSYLPMAAPATGYNAKTGVITAVLAAPSRDNLLGTLKTQQANVWHYRFDWAQQPAPWNEVYGAAHGFDIGFLFGNFGPSLFSSVTNSAANRPGRVALSKAWMASVGAFMRSGNPNTVELGVSWTPWPSSLSLDATPDATRIGVQTPNAP